MRNLKLLYITDTFPFGAGEVFFHPEVAALRKLGVDVRLFPIMGRPKMFHPRGLELASSVLGEGGAWGRPLMALSSQARFAPRNLALLRSTKPLFGRLKALARNHFAIGRAMSCLHGMGEWKPDHVHAQWANYTATAAWALSRWLKAPWSFTAHRYDIVADNLFAQKAAAAAFVRFISESGLRMARGLGLVSDSQKCHVSHMGVDGIPDAPVAISAREEIVAVVPGNLVAVKGHSTFLEAIAMVGAECRGRLKALIVGDGELRPELERQIRSEPRLGKVEMLGRLPHDELMRMYRGGGVDMVVLPSLDLGSGHHEGVPISLMEAMGHGIPVISTLTGGIPELVDPASGELVAPGDAASLAKAIQELAGSLELRRAKGASAHRRIQEGFTGKLSAERLVRQIQGLGNGHHSDGGASMRTRDEINTSHK